MLASIEWNQSMTPTAKAASAEAKTETFLESAMKHTKDQLTRGSPSQGLTETLKAKLANPETSAEFDLHKAVNDVLGDVGLTVADAGGKLTFYGQDPIIPSRFRFGSMAAIGLAAASVAVAALWKHRTGEGQDVSVDVRKALRRFCGFNEQKWETINGRPASAWGYAGTPFLRQPLNLRGHAMAGT